ncbi:MAG: ABC transporter permease, partial [Hungatella sp.]
NAGVLTNETSVDLVQKYAQIINSLLSNQLMLVMVAAFAISILVVFLIRNLSIDYAWMFAIIAGTVTQLGVIFIGDFVFNVSVPMVQLILGAVLSVLLAGVYDFMFFSVDYSRTEYTQFEDDDYYYYVKAVPKLTVSAPDVKVQKISIKKSSKGTKTL